MRRFLVLGCLVFSIPAQASFLDAHLSGKAAIDTTDPTAPPPTFTVNSGFDLYAASLDLPQIDASQLGRYSLALTGSMPTTDSSGAVHYMLTGGIEVDGVMVDALLPTSASMGFGLNGQDQLFAMLLFNTPISNGFDFTPANGDYLAGTITPTSSTDGSFVGRIVNPVTNNVPEPAAIALFGLGLLAVAKRRARV